MKKGLILLVFVAHNLFSQTAEELFNMGNEEYKLEHYSEAIIHYQKIEDLGLSSSE